MLPGLAFTAAAAVVCAGEMSKLLSSQWGEMSDEGRAPYSQTFSVAMAEWKMRVSGGALFLLPSKRTSAGASWLPGATLSAVSSAAV